MEIILLEKIRNLGDVGQVVDVKDGYGRNFLIKFGKALRADKKNIEYVNRKRTEINKKNIEQKKIAKEIYEKIKKKTLVFEKETKENGELYGNIKPKEISKYFLDNLKQTVHPSQIDLKQEINKIGEFSLSINLHSDLVAELRVLVEKKKPKK
jgi:large subunit ribosomal protein L9